jgi:hypothetical protein
MVKHQSCTQYKYQLKLKKEISNAPSVYHKENPNQLFFSFLLLQESGKNRKVAMLVLRFHAFLVFVVLG